MKRTVCVLVPLVCGLPLTRIDFPRDSHPSRSFLLGNPHQCRGRVRQGSCLLRPLTFFFVAASFYPGAPFLCFVSTNLEATFPIPSQQVWILSSPPLYKWRPGAKRPACPPRQKCPIGQAYSQFLNSPTRLPPSQIPKTPHPEMCTTPPAAPTPPAAKLHNAQCVTASQSALAATMVSQGHVLGTPLFVPPCRKYGIWKRALPAM